MEERFRMVLLQEAKDFLASLEKKTRKKILYNIWKSKLLNDKTLFKPLERGIWEFRAYYGKQQIRLFAFWDKTDKIETLVVATHGLIKKTPKIPKQEIEKALNLKKMYFKEKNNDNQIK